MSVRGRVKNHGSGEKISKGLFAPLKEKVIEHHTYAYADYKLSYILHTDASSNGIGAVLRQKANFYASRVCD